MPQTYRNLREVRIDDRNVKPTKSARGRVMQSWSSACGLLVIVFLVGMTVAGCASTENQKAWKWPAPAAKSGGGGDGAVQSNIVRVNKFFRESPWLSFDSDGSKNVDGVTFTVYLEGPSQPKGVFGTGTLIVNMYRLDFDPMGRETAVPVHEWVLTSEDAYPWRARTPTALGWGYGLRLQWPKELKVGGKQVAFVVKYVREDGRTISSSRQVLKVPFSGAVPAKLS